jgi:integrator complex subunit 4
MSHEQQRKRKRDDEKDEDDGNKRIRLLKENDEQLQLVVQRLNDVIQGLNYNDALTWLQSQYEPLISLLRKDPEGAKSLVKIIISIVLNWTQTNLKLVLKVDEDDDEYLEERDDETTSHVEEEGILYAIRLLSSIVLLCEDKQSEEQAANGLISILAKIYGETSTQTNSKRLGRHVLSSLVIIANQMQGTNIIADTMSHTTLLKRLLSDWDYNVRSTAIQLYVITSEPTDQVRELICTHMNDRDARVRAESLRCLQTWFKKSTATIPQDPIEEEREANRIAKPIYTEVVATLKDDYADVKTEAMDLLCVIANRFPKLRQRGLFIVEDAFVKLCTMVRDTTVPVRAKATMLLGRLERSDLIAANVLLETFNQISLDYDPSKVFQQNQGGANRKPVPETGPMTEVTENEDDQRLYADAIGTFVLGLEDEFRQVRMGCIDSIGKLSARSAEFAHRSKKFLLESFNDEIDEVRIASIECLTWIARQAEGSVELNHAQLLIVLVLVGDRNRKIRFAVHELLSHIILSGGPISLAAAVKALVVTEMRKFGEGTLTVARQERESVYQCLAKMGRNHPELCELLVEELLQIKAHIMSPEQPLDDDNDPYVGALILLFNASTRNECIVSLMPEHIRQKHLSQVRNRWPQFFPDGIRVLNFGRHYSTSIYENHIKLNESIDYHEHQTQERLLNGFNQVQKLAILGELRSANATLSALRAELSHITQQTPITAFASLYIQMCHLYLAMLVRPTNGRYRTVHRDLLRILRKIATLYLPIAEDEESRPLRHQLKLIQTMVLVNRLKTNPHDTTLHQLVEEHFNEMNLTTTDPRANFPTLVLPSLTMLSVVPSFEITAPQPSGSDKSTSFPSYVPLQLHVECAAHRSVHLTAGVFLLVQFYDGSHSLFPMSQEDRFLQSDVHFDLEAWTEPAPVTLSLVLSSQEEDLRLGQVVGDDALESRFVKVSEKEISVYIHPYQR